MALLYILLFGIRYGPFPLRLYSRGEIQQNKQKKLRKGFLNWLTFFQLNQSRNMGKWYYLHLACLAAMAAFTAIVILMFAVPAVPDVVITIPATVVISCVLLMSAAATPVETWIWLEQRTWRTSDAYKYTSVILQVAIYLGALGVWYFMLLKI